jgi:hypothetical protein
MDTAAKVKILTLAGLSCGANCACVKVLAGQVDDKVVETIGHIVKSKSKHVELAELSNDLGKNAHQRRPGSPGSMDDVGDAMTAAMLLSLLAGAGSRRPGGHGDIFSPFGFGSSSGGRSEGLGGLFNSMSPEEEAAFERIFGSPDSDFPEGDDALDMRGMLRNRPHPGR